MWDTREEALEETKVPGCHPSSHSSPIYRGVIPSSLPPSCEPGSRGGLPFWLRLSPSPYPPRELGSEVLMKVSG